jgi:hypothetical protein
MLLLLPSLLLLLPAQLLLGLLSASPFFGNRLLRLCHHDEMNVAIENM